MLLLLYLEFIGLGISELSIYSPASILETWPISYTLALDRKDTTRCQEPQLKSNADIHKLTCALAAHKCAHKSVKKLQALFELHTHGCIFSRLQ